MLSSNLASSRALRIHCALLCLLIALLALSGWLFGLPVLATFVSDGASVFPATAVGFIAVSAALTFDPVSANRKWRSACLLAAAGAASLGLLSAALRLARWAPAPWTLAVGADATVWSLPSPASSILFFAIGTSLTLMHLRKSIALAQAIAVATLLISFLVVIGYLSKGTVLYALLPGKGIALPTALCFMLAATGALSLHPREGWMLALSDPATGRRTLYQLFLPALAPPILLGLAATSLTRGNNAMDIGTVVWLMIWVLLIVLIIVIWRFAYHLQQQEIARGQAERDRQVAIDALRRADERKNEFLAMLAHELRNPLAPIGTAAELLRIAHAPGSDQVRRASEIITRQVDHMVHLINDLLDVSRVTRGIIVLQKEALDARRLVADALEQSHPLVAMKRHRLRVDLPDAALVVDGDHKRLVQVLANLINNAAKYTPEGGDLLVRLAMEGDKAAITVEDNGIGIAADLLSDVFEIFTQAKRTPDRAQGGLGLGLALVKSIVELHGGRVSAHSHGPGKGSAFTVVLPLASPQASAPQKVEPETATAGHALKIMVIDDNADAADTLSLMLKAEGHAVEVAYHASAALEAVRLHRPDVCIIDIGLPGMDGNALARRIRSLNPWSAPTLVALSGYGHRRERNADAVSMFDHYFVKPVSGRDLTALLTQLALSKVD